MPHVFTYLGVCGFSALFGLSGCQSVSRNNQPTPPQPVAPEGQDILQDMINKEIIPALQYTRTSLAILDSVKSEDNASSSLSNLFYELEKAFKSAASPQSTSKDSQPQKSDSHYQFEIPFVSGTVNETLVARISRDRDPAKLTYDFFGMKSKNPDAEMGMDVMFSRYNDAESKESNSYWAFHPIMMNAFFKKIKDSDEAVMDPTIHVEFSTVEDEIDLFATSDELKTGVAGILWDQFRANTNKKSPDQTNVTFRVKCDKSPKSFNMVIDQKVIQQGFRQIFVDTFKLKLGSVCSKK